MALFLLVAAGFALVLIWKYLVIFLISKGQKASISNLFGAIAGVVAAVLTFQIGISIFRSEVHHKAWEGDMVYIQNYIADGGDIDAVQSDGSTLLAYAAGGGSTELVSFLLSKGAKINNGIPSPLHIAAREGHSNTVSLLLSYGANPNVFLKSYPRSSSEKSSDFPYECTPLHWVISNKNLEQEKKSEVIKVLLNHGSNPNEFNAECSVPIFEAVRIGDLSTARLLLENGAWTNPVKHIKGTDQIIVLLRNPNTPPFHLAILLNNYEMVELFLEHGANPNVTVIDGDGLSHSPIQLAKDNNTKTLLKKYGGKEYGIVD